MHGYDGTCQFSMDLIFQNLAGSLLLPANWVGTLI